MRTTILIAALVLAAGGAGADEPAVQTFEGKYKWNQGGSDKLTAEFKPLGDQEWDVKFHFDFDGERHTWKGTAKGSLAEGGSVTGIAESANGGRTWAFEAALEDGVLAGTHAETTGGRSQDSGSFSLER